MWTLIPDGKHQHKTWPQVAFADPDYLFWAAETHEFGGGLLLRYQLIDVAQKARNIKPIVTPAVFPSAEVAVDYILDPVTQLFSEFEVVSSTQKAAGPDVIRLDRINLGLPRKVKEYDKRGNRLMVRCLRKLLLPPHRNMTKRRCEQFFYQQANFILPEGYRPPFTVPATAFCTGGCLGHCLSDR